VGSETEWQGNEWREPDVVAKDLLEAAAAIMHAAPAPALEEQGP
jgi:hypothetical protein